LECVTKDMPGEDNLTAILFDACPVLCVCYIDRWSLDTVG
jgi:hypothetical protein